MNLADLMKKSPLVRGAVIAPSMVVLVFGFFNLTATPDPVAAVRAVSVGIVNQDEGVPTPAGAQRIAERIVGGLAAQLPFKTETFATADGARLALDEGRIAAALVIPADFSRSVATGAPVRATVLNSDHLSQVETQLGRTLPAQLQAGLSLAVLTARAQMQQAAAGLTPVANAPAPAAPQAPVVVGTETLHAAADAATLAAPFVLSFAGWMAGLIGSILLFVGTRSQMKAAGAGLVSAARIAIPVVAALGGGLMAALAYATVTGSWDSFVELWMYRWLVSAAVMATLTALFSLFGFAAILAAVPLVFYQGIASGILAPVAATPRWIAWINDVLPLGEMTMGLRTILIGGPDGSVPWIQVSTLWIGATVLIAAGTMLYARFVPARG